MKKTQLALAASELAGAALAQPMRPPPPPQGPGLERPHMDRRGHVQRRHQPRKVWVPAHRVGMRRVPGHYVWRR